MHLLTVWAVHLVSQTLFVAMTTTNPQEERIIAILEQVMTKT
jgi:hypothetical protein